eukprot:3215388-Pyramimonas_sp.AAC.2
MATRTPPKPPRGPMGTLTMPILSPKRPPKHVQTFLYSQCGSRRIKVCARKNSGSKKLLDV